MTKIFNNIMQCENQLKKVKYTVLEGYISELIWLEGFFLKTKYPYSKGWWKASYKNEEGKLEDLFFLFKNSPKTAFDDEIIRFISSKFQVFFVSYNINQFLFEDVSKKIYSQQDFLKKFPNLNKKNPLSSHLYNSKRTTDTINFFKSKRILNSIAEERYFADDFLSVFFDYPVNIDVFFKNKNDEIILGEIKYKFETSNGTFGINLGQACMIDNLEKKGFLIGHFILYNHTKNINFSILDMIALPNYQIPLYYKRISNILNYNRKEAPSKTSIAGNRTQIYYEIPFVEFKHIVAIK